MKTSVMLTTILATLLILTPAGAVPKDGQASISDPNDWRRFNPKHSKGEVIPSAALIPDELMIYKEGSPSFPHDPSKTSMVFGRGEKYHPTEIYAKAFDPVMVDGKPVSAPAAGQSIEFELPDKGKVALWGTTCYTPLSDTRCILNTLGVAPFNPNRIFFTSSNGASAVIYGDPESSIMIMGQYQSFPAGGATQKLSVAGHDITLVGVLKGVPQPNLLKPGTKQINQSTDNSDTQKNNTKKGAKPKKH